MSFKVGQKIVCIDVNSIINYERMHRYNATELKKHEVYICVKLFVDEDGDEVICLHGLDGAYLTSRFRPLDYDFVEDVIKQVKEEVLC